MNYRGVMDGWFGDEYECLGQCGICNDCDERYYHKCDVDYDSSSDED